MTTQIAKVLTAEGQAAFLTDDQAAKGYCGGSCTETVRSAQLCVHVAMACGADQLLVKPGMGADAGLSVVRTEMARVLALTT